MSLHSHVISKKTNQKIFLYMLDDRDGSLNSEDHRTARDNDAIRGQNQCKWREMNVRDAHDAFKEKRKIERVCWNGPDKKVVVERGRQSESKRMARTLSIGFWFKHSQPQHIFFAHCMSFLQTLKTTQFLRFKKMSRDSLIKSCHIHLLLDYMIIRLPLLAVPCVRKPSCVNVTDLAAVNHGVENFLRKQFCYCVDRLSRVLFYARSPRWNSMHLKRQLGFRLALFSFESK